ncbi:COQ9 family protein [Novosphingobium piscinae]|uniref:COQ9 family protein n=1 Tax=Novosphingobium piscinae TaxID=1507448 RepID=A0A7X1KRL6_9SPHN|nr:COQ9 family protein [Novosphingobium piscinae]MBC2670693.1 COQ9 family protein [Novosphingobium piscinae]
MTIVMDPADMTLDELRLALAPEIASAAMFDGWTTAAVTHAAEAFGVDPATARLAYPDGAMDMIVAWIERIDADMAAALPAATLQTLPVRERIRSLVQFRLDALAGLDEAVRRALSIMALPQNAARAARLSWGSADAMWRLAGDTAADYNHYTKRATLAALYAATLLAHVNDRSEDKAETRAFLDRRIAGVMRFEKAKARCTRPSDETFSVTRLVGRLRYPAR